MMVRTIGSIVVGYLAMALVVFAGLTLAYLVVGPDRAFRPGVFDVSPLWVAISIVVGFGAAFLGGWLARRISGTVRGPQLLAGLVVILGLALALPALLGDPAAAGMRADALGPFDAMMQAQTPLWLMLLNPVIGAIGVLVGGRALGVASGADAGALATHR
jgi:hypothetical protein